MTEVPDAIQEQVQAKVQSARDAAVGLASLDTARRSALLHAMADALTDPSARAPVLEANQRDMVRAREEESRGDLAPALVKRLALSVKKLDGLSRGLHQLGEAPEVVGRLLESRDLDEGLSLERRSCPLGSIGVVFEARPDAVPQIAGLALKSGNAAILKGGSEAKESNRALVDLIHRVMSGMDIDPNCVCLLEDRREFRALLALEDLVDIIIARGSGAFVKMVQESTTIPVMGHAEGLCHIYLHGDADPTAAAHVVVDAKCSYPAACNAVETLLWHDEATLACTSTVKALLGAGVELRACARTRERMGHTLDPSLARGLKEATDADWSAEYTAPILAIRHVDGLEAALEHIARYGSKHTECIITRDPAVAEGFIARIDAACVFHNASTRFADGFRFGLGAEVGISTSKLHARGPVGVEGLLTYRWILRGHGQATMDYGPEKRRYLHEDAD